MKRYGLLLIAGIMAATLAACGENQPKAPQTTNENATQSVPAHNTNNAETPDVRPMNSNAGNINQ